MGQGFAHERLPEKGTVLLLDTYDLTDMEGQEGGVSGDAALPLL